MGLVLVWRFSKFLWARMFYYGRGFFNTRAINLLRLRKCHYPWGFFITRAVTHMTHRYVEGCINVFKSYLDFIKISNLLVWTGHLHWRNWNLTNKYYWLRKHYHREILYFHLVEIWRDETLYISCRNCKRWDGILVILASSVHIAARVNCIFYDQESLQNTVFNESLQSLSNAHSAYSWVAYL